MKCIKNTSKTLIKLTEKAYRKSLYDLYQCCRDTAQKGLHSISVEVNKIDGIYYAKTEAGQYVPCEVVKEYFEARGYKLELLTASDWSIAKILYIRW